MEVGDKVNYVPHEGHALAKGPDGEFAFEFGWKSVEMTPGPPGRPPVPRDKVTPLTEAAAHQHIEYIHRHPDPEKEREKLVIIRPKRPWPAVVTGVNEDGSFNLAVEAPASGVTLHYEGVVVDRGGKRHHSCHTAEGQK